MRGGHPLWAFCALLAGWASGPADAQSWDRQNLDALRAVIASASREGLDPAAYDVAAIASARAGAPETDALATKVAVDLAHDFGEGAAPKSARLDWHIDRPARNYGDWLDEGLARHDLRGRYAALLPDAPGYVALRSALETCEEASVCQLLKVNLERWRWLPREFRDQYVWINVPAYRLDLMADGLPVSTHKVIVGKEASPTPVFTAMITGVTLNPWWNVPCSIVDESIGRLVKTNPAEAARRGYVASVDSKGKMSVRQKPGPDNALGQIKLEMPNPYDVYVHDTPSRSLFNRDQRALSHGCVRTENPGTLAKAILDPDQAASVDIALQTGATRTLKLARPLPVMVVYFTADTDPATGAVRRYSDIYRRDAPVAAALGIKPGL